jgi:hypothetical protein
VKIHFNIHADIKNIHPHSGRNETSVEINVFPKINSLSGEKPQTRSSGQRIDQEEK